MWRWLVVVFWLMASPSFGQDASRIYADEDAGSVKTAVLVQADKRVRQFFAQTFDQRIESPIILVGTTGQDQLNDHLMIALTELGRRPRAVTIDTAKLCKNKPIGAAANRSYIVMCWLKPKAYNDKWIASISRRLAPILAHEFTHQLQYHLAGDDPPQRLKGTDELLLGPSWLVEGSAEVFERLYGVQNQGVGAGADAGQTLFNLQIPARRSRLTLAQLTVAGSTKGSGAYGTSRFAAFLLAERSGAGALLKYFEVLGEVKDRDLAFSQVFGLSLEKFEADFERVRRNFSAATQYAAGGT